VRGQGKLLAQPIAVAGVRGQRVAGPAGLGKRGDQQLHGPLPPGLLRRDGLQRGRGLGQAAQPQQHGRTVLLGGQPQLPQAQRLPPRERLGELGVGRAAPQRQRLIQQRQRRRRRGRIARPDQQRTEALHVHRVPRQLQEVAGGPGDDHGRCRAERLAQPGGVGLQGVAGILRRPLAEQVVDQPLERDDAAAAQQQRGQQRPLPRPGHRDGPTGHPHLQRPQDAEIRLVLQAAHPSIGPPGPPAPPAVAARLVAGA
jgi:hypothetical protein